MVEVDAEINVARVGLDHCNRYIFRNLRRQDTHIFNDQISSRIVALDVGEPHHSFCINNHPRSNQAICRSIRPCQRDEVVVTTIGRPRLGAYLDRLDSGSLRCYSETLRGQVGENGVKAPAPRDLVGRLKRTAATYDSADKHVIGGPPLEIVSP